MNNLAFLRKLLGMTKPYWPRLALGILCGFLAGLASPLLMGSVKLVVDTVFPQAGAPSLADQLQKAPALLRQLVEPIVRPALSLDLHGSKWGTLLVILTIPITMFLRGFFSYLNIYLMHWVSSRAVTDLKTRLFDHLLTLSSSFFSRTSTGELIARFSELNFLQGMISYSMVTLIKDPITVISLLGFLFAQQPKLTLVAMLVFPLTLAPFLIYSGKVRKSSAAIHREHASLSKLLHEAFTGYRIVKAYNLEEKLGQEFRKASRAAISHYMRVLRSSQIPGPLIEFFAALGLACFFIYIAFFSPMKATPGDLLQFVGSIFLAYQPIKALLRLHNQLEEAQAATQSVFDILASLPAVPEPANPVLLRAAGADIRFDGVDFSYGEKTVLRNVQLTVPAGRMVALVGSSGAGKTTVMSLLLRFYDPQRGSIRIGETEIRNVSTRDLRNQIAVVTQETVLFNDTIRNNIALGRPGATDEEIEAAARHAHAHEFIVEKRHSYDSVIGEKGVNLSGGQRQRLAIARAILKNAPILLLDEATSSLDSESERAVQAALDELMQGRTTICIAHRLSTIQRADLIVVVDEGRIVEQGKHAELIQRGGVYQKLHELQFQS